MKKAFIPDMIEVSVKSTSPWKGVLQDAMQKYLTDWGWQVNCYRDNDTLIFVGIENVKTKS